MSPWWEPEVYDPWGKPGGGAPGTQRGRQRLTGILPADNPDHVSYVPSVGSPQHKPRPRPKTEVDKEIYFQGGAGAARHVDRTMRFLPDRQQASAYKEELNTLVQEKQRAEAEQRRQDSEILRTAIQHNPYGKPGAGAPNRTLSGKPAIRLSHRKPPAVLASDLGSLYRSNNSSRANSGANFPDPRSCVMSAQSGPGSPRGVSSAKYDPWNKGFGNPDRDDLGYVRRRPNSDIIKSPLLSRNTSPSVSEAPEPLSPATVQVRPNINGHGGFIQDQIQEEFSPFSSGKQKARNPITGDIFQRKFPPQQNQMLLLPVQKEKTVEYQKELAKQANEREVRQREEKHLSIALDTQHEAKFSSVWGKPGHGAPKEDNRMKKWTLQ